MSGETEEITADANSVDSALIWTDNPELEYFRSIMASRIDDKLASGLDAEDSLIGNSTVREMLEEGHYKESNYLNDGSPLRRLGVRDTSGLSDAESNTVDNIFIGDESIFAMKKTLNRVFDDGTIESSEDQDLVPPITRTRVGQNLYQHQNQEQKFNTPNQHITHRSESRQNTPPHRQPQYILPPQMNNPHARDNVNREPKESANIPGFIFVTDGHPSIVQTRPDLQSDKTSKYNERGEHKKERTGCLKRSLFICLTLVAIVASSVVAVLIYRIKNESSVSASSQRQNDGLPFLIQNTPPTSEPSSLRATNRPQGISGKSASNPVTDELQTTGPEPTFAVPSEMPSMNPSPSPTKTIFFPPVEEDVIEPVPSTPSPESLTGSPTILTTPSTSATLSSCVSTISTAMDCYENGNDIQISFNNCEPTSSDWIGIYSARQAVPNLRQPLTWVWACGNQLCNNSTVSGEATIYDASGFGTFRAYLLRDNENSGAGYSAYATGNRFTITSRCN